MIQHPAFPVQPWTVTEAVYRPEIPGQADQQCAALRIPELIQASSGSAEPLTEVLSGLRRRLTRIIASRSIRTRSRTGRIAPDQQPPVNRAIRSPGAAARSETKGCAGTNLGTDMARQGR